jgi:sortase B
MRGYIRRLFVGILLLAGCFFFCMACREHKPFAEAKEKQEALVAVVAGEDTLVDDPLMRQIDFEALREINPDIIGWLYVPQIGVDLPVLQGRDNHSYLNLDFEGNVSPVGSIFTWSHADEKLSDMHICLFGHNMPSGQIFGKLSAFKDMDFTQKNRKFYLYTPKRAKELEVVSVFECDRRDGVFQDGYAGGKTEPMVTLATCTGYGATSDRLVVNGYVVQERLVLR